MPIYGTIPRYRTHAFLASAPEPRVYIKKFDNFMEYEVGIKPHNSRNDIFFSVARAHGGGKTLGIAEFWRECTKTPARWGARVDVKENRNIRGNGVATAILRAGDLHIRSNFPGELRLFHDLNEYSYLVYTSLIADAQLVDFTDEGLIFYP